MPYYPDYAKQYREAHREEIKENKRLWDEQHRNHRAVYGRQYRLLHPEQQHNWRAANKDKANVNQRRYRVENHDTTLQYKNTRRARKAGNFIEEVDRQQVFLNDVGICQWQYCSESSPYVDPSNWHLDHVIPFSKGGEHSYRNTQVTHPRCNLQKNNRIP
jgi:5-methylcytosine-specific restriction endonuclease McrA